jgi:hypothetical protein
MIEIKCTNWEATISLNIKHPNDRGSIEVTGDTSLRDRLNGAAGFRHGFYPDACTGFDLVSALADRGVEYEVIQGTEILEMPEEELQEGVDD